VLYFIFTQRSNKTQLLEILRKNGESNSTKVHFSGKDRKQIREQQKVRIPAWLIGLTSVQPSLYGSDLTIHTVQRIVASAYQSCLLLSAEGLAQAYQLYQLEAFLHPQELF